MYQNLLEIYRVLTPQFSDRRIIRYKPDAVIGEPMQHIHDFDIHEVYGTMIIFEIEDDEQEPT